MVSSRPDWCISRQRIWGVPIAVFLCTGCRSPLNDPAVHRRVVALFAAEGADAWYVRDAAEILPPGTVCASCGGSDFKKEMDILDVWFESGASQAAVLGDGKGSSLACRSLYRGWRPASWMVPVFPALRRRYS